MKSYNFSFTFYFLDTRPLSEIRSIVEEALSCKLKILENDSYQDNNCFEGRVLGFDINLEFTETWPEGYAYRLAGSNMTILYTDGAQDVALDHHVSKLLMQYGLENFMMPSDYIREMKIRFPELYS